MCGNDEFMLLAAAFPTMHLTSNASKSPMTSDVVPPKLWQNLAKSSRYALYSVLRMTLKSKCEMGD